MRLKLALAACILAVAAPATATKIHPVFARDAWVRLPAVPGRPGAGYMTLTAAQPARLTGAASPLAARVELHSSSMAGGVMRMDKLPAVELRKGVPFSFAPAGNHLMLFDISASVKPGHSIPILLSFADGSTLRVEAKARAAGEPAAADPHAGH